MHIMFPRLRYRAGSRGFRADDLKFFVDKSGDPLKFRLQPSLPKHLEEKLRSIIELHGGTVIPRIPVKGIVVVDSESKAGKELINSWKWKERPDRHFVNHDFVMKCVEEKRMLPLVNFSLGSDIVKNGPGQPSKAQRALSEEAKDKLILYLATKLPMSMRDKFSSNRIYKDLVKKKNVYPWVRKYTWQTFRDYYCKNKRYINKLIGYVVPCTSTGPSTACFSRGSLIIEQRDGDSVPEHEKKLKKRKFGDDKTNIQIVPKKLKTIDEMLHKPLPRFEVHKAKLAIGHKDAPSKKHTNPIVSQKVRVGRKLVGTSPADGLEEIEVGRSVNQQPHMRDIWFDDTFRGTRMPGPERSPNPRGELAVMTANLDFDDLRCAVALDSTLLKDDDDTEDEDYVARLLGLTDEPFKETANAKDKPLDAEHCVTADFLRSGGSSGPAGKIKAQETHSKADIETLAQDSQFSVEEVSQKLAAFNGNMDMAREFFMCCRGLIDVLFADFFKNGDALKLSAAALKSVTAYPGESKKHEEVDMSSASFPAWNTRARAAALAVKRKTESEK